MTSGPSYVSSITGLPIWSLDGSGNVVQAGNVTSGDGFVYTTTATPPVPVAGQLKAYSPDGLTMATVDATGKVTVVTGAGAVASTVNGTGAATSSLMVQLNVTGDSNPRFDIQADGTQNWGSGSGATDTNLYRQGSNNLATDSSFNVTGTSLLQLPGALATTDKLGAFVTGDANARFRLRADGSMNWGPGNAARDTTLSRVGVNQLQCSGDFQVQGNVVADKAGSGFRVIEGANAKQGVSTLVGGTVVVSNTSVTANSRIFLTHQSVGGTAGFLVVSARSAGVSFTILSSSGTDTSVIGWEIFEPGP